MERSISKNMKKIISIIIVLISLTSCIHTQEDELNQEVEGTTFVMDTVVIVKLFEGGSSEILESMFNKLDEIDKLMSLDNVNSDVYKINEYAGNGLITVTDETLQVIKKSFDYSEKSNGAFDISFGPLINLWNINTDQTKIPMEEDIEKALTLINYKNITIDGQQIGLNNKNMSIDLGGIAKGYAADIISDMAINAGVTSGIINIGGNICVIGSKDDESPFSIGIQNPFAIRNGYLGIVSVKDKTVVTSGNYERYFELDGKRYHHILNKDTGFPVDNGLAAVSIITDSSIDADALSTVIYILGVEKGLKLIESIEGSECLFISDDYNIYLSSGMDELFVLTDKKFNIVEAEGVK